MKSNHCICRRLLVMVVTVAVCVTMFGNISKVHAASTYQIKINKQQNCVTIYKLDSNGKYKPVKAMVCSTGYATPVGTFPLGEKMRWHTLMGPCYGQYCTRIHGGVLFHSVWYYKQTPSSLSASAYNKLGVTASHGCVRLTVADAKWIYDNVPSGSPVTVYNSSNPGPLGKPSAIKLPYSTGWDPTDKWSSGNPWNKKKPSISGTKNQTVPYNGTYSARKGVTAKNTTGYDATSRLKVSFRYHGAAVKKVDTRKPGVYKVIYKLKDEIGRKVQKIIKVKVTSSLPAPKIGNAQDLYVKSADQLTRARALKHVTVTQKGRKLARKYIKVIFKKQKKGVYKVTYKAQNASDLTEVSVKAYVDSQAPKITGVTDGADYPVEPSVPVNEKYARSLIGVSDNVSDLKVSDVQVKISKQPDESYQVVYEVQDQAGNKTKITIHLTVPVSQPVSGAAVQ